MILNRGQSFQLKGRKMKELCMIILVVYILKD